MRAPDLLTEVVQSLDEAGVPHMLVADAATVLAVGGEALDREYLDRWAEVLGVVGLLERARRG